MLDRVLPVAIVFATAPAVASALLEDAPLTATLWWLLLAPAAAMVLVACPGTVVVVAIHWRELWRVAEPSERPSIIFSVLLLVGGAAAIPLVIVAATAAGVELRLATVLGLAAGYIGWHLVYARVPHGEGDRTVEAS